MIGPIKITVVSLALLLAIGLSAGRDLLAQGPSRDSFGRGGPSRGYDRGRSWGERRPSDMVRYLDRNRNGTIEPHELVGGLGERIKGIAREKRIDLSKPISIDQLAKSLKGRKDNRRRSSRSLATEDDYGRALPPGFGGDDDTEGAEPVPGFGNEAEKYSVKIVDADHRTVEDRFRRYDSDRNGYLSREELRRNRWDDDPLKYDRNRDGRLSKSEMAVRYAQRRLREVERRRDEEKRRRGDGRGSSDGRDSRGRDDSRTSRMVQWVFDRYDRNKNGRLDRDEWGKMRTNPAEADADRNNTITREEYSRWTAKRSAGSSWGGWGSRRTESRESGRSKRGSERRTYSYVAPHDRLPRGLDEWFIDADADRDGQVAMSEFASSFDEAVVKNFREFDLNNDGIITPRECLRADRDGAEYEGGAARASTPRRTSPPPRSAAPSAKSPLAASPQPKPAASSSSPVVPSPVAPTPVAPTKISPSHLAIYRKLFDKYDTNKDGALVQDEWSKMSRPPEDANGNGRITLDEYIAWSTR